ncbi:hypothetical protein TREES_T100014946 [Tupaia chinensis]|uniref:Uncharacterized protein n=1 Tax=Tupaia chinensis TaxID=246437 RepID=L9KP25_TUPCH|nr:hypothetical protein TREES_T100014946 [Tupaia chinensis]
MEARLGIRPTLAAQPASKTRFHRSIRAGLKCSTGEQRAVRISKPTCSFCQGPASLPSRLGQKADVSQAGLPMGQSLVTAVRSRHICSKASTLLVVSTCQRSGAGTLHPQSLGKRLCLPFPKLRQYDIFKGKLTRIDEDIMSRNTDYASVGKGPVCWPSEAPASLDWSTEGPFQGESQAVKASFMSISSETLQTHLGGRPSSCARPFPPCFARGSALPSQRPSCRNLSVFQKVDG